MFAYDGKTRVLLQMHDGLLQQRFYRGLVRRLIDPATHYVGQAASKYYACSTKTKVVDGVLRFDLPYEAFVRAHLPVDQTLVLVSLGCGNASIDKTIVEGLQIRHADMIYIGVDIAKEMIDMAVENFAGIKRIQKFFVCDDYTDQGFAARIRGLVPVGARLVWAFFGYSITNQDPAYVFASLYQCMQPDEKLWFDVYSREEQHPAVEMSLFQRYLAYDVSSPFGKWLCEPLVRVGLPDAQGRMVVSTSRDEMLGLLSVSYDFCFDDSYHIVWQGRDLFFLAKERLRLGTVRNFYVPQLMQYLQSHGFSLVDHSMVHLEDALFSAQLLVERV